MALDKKLTEEEKKEIITELYREYLHGRILMLSYKLNHPLVNPENTFSLLEKRISLEVERKKKPIIRFLSMYLEDSKYLLTRERTLKDINEIKKELQEIFTIKLRGHSSAVYPPNFSRLERVASFHEVKDLDELMECGIIIVPKGLAVSKLGTGAGGSVYKVYRGDLKQYYALKVINKKINEKEAELMARLKRQDLENIVQIQDAGNHLVTANRKKEYAILMEYVDGQTLEEILHERKLTSHEVLDYSAQILNGIQSLRKHGITHRDLNLRNIKVNSQGEVKILDFGIATDEPNPPARNNRKYGPSEGEEADDLISFGLLVYKMTTGEHLVDVPGKETIGSGTYADEIDRIKQSLYRNGKITEEYDKKIWGISSDDYDPLYDDYANCTHEEHNIKLLLGDIIRSALWEKDLKILTGKYPTPYKFKIMDAKELRQSLFLSMKDGEKLAFDNYVLYCKVPS